ncbi:MAG TPA: NCS2 family permease, partial [Rhizomicrobium sp.]|nr:NCS2 family permease [Rhizomicrobium sp.]
MFDRMFALDAHGTTVRRELVAGATTFFTMAYVMFVNPAILAKTGMDPGAVFVATCLASALAS